jgi:hypothetical protein
VYAFHLGKGGASKKVLPKSSKAAKCEAGKIGSGGVKIEGKAAKQELKCQAMKAAKKAACENTTLHKRPKGKPVNVSKIATKSKFVDNLDCSDIAQAIKYTALCIAARKKIDRAIRKKLCSGSQKPDAQERHDKETQIAIERLGYLLTIRSLKGC